MVSVRGSCVNRVNACTHLLVPVRAGDQKWSGVYTVKPPLVSKHQSTYVHTVRLEILVGDLFWWIGSFESNPPIFLTANLRIALCHHYYVIPLSWVLWTPNVRRRTVLSVQGRQTNEPYVVVVKTDADTLVGNVPRKT